MTPIDWLMGDDTGISSKVICAVMTGSAAPDWADTPADPDDFGRCYRLLAKFPEWRERMPEVAAELPKWGPMVSAWDELTEMYERCCAMNGEYTRESYLANKNMAHALYERMKELNDAGLAAAGWTRDGPYCWLAPANKQEQVTT